MHVYRCVHMYKRWSAMCAYIEDEEGGEGGKRRRRRRRPKRQTCLASTRPEAHHRCLDLRISVDRRLMPRTRHTVGERGWKGGREIDNRWDAEEGSGREEGLYGASRGNILRRSAN